MSTGRNRCWPDNSTMRTSFSVRASAGPYSIGLGSENLDEVAPTFANRNSLESLRLEPYYLYTAGQVPPAADLLLALTDETRATRLTLVHGDYSPKNVLLRKQRLILVDHEVMHFGDPALDVGFALSPSALQGASRVRPARPLRFSFTPLLARVSTEQCGHGRLTCWRHALCGTPWPVYWRARQAVHHWNI